MFALYYGTRHVGSWHTFILCSRSFMSLEDAVVEVSRRVSGANNCIVLREVIRDVAQDYGIKEISLRRAYNRTQVLCSDRFVLSCFALRNFVSFRYKICHLSAEFSVDFIIACIL